MNSYISLAGVSLLPVLLAILLYLLDRSTPFSRLNDSVKQIIFGVLFGLLAVMGTEFGIPLDGAVVNCRDAAVLTAGLLFGGPAGIIAGFIGGIERWIAVAWGVGTFTRAACTISTILAGFYAAVLRRYMFEGKKPGWLIALAVGVVMEILHLTMVFITNIDAADQAMEVVRICTVPMVLANGLSVMLATLALAVLAGETRIGKGGTVRISQTIQRWLLITVSAAFVVTTFFVFRLQDAIALSQADSKLDLALNEISADIRDYSDENMLTMAYQVSTELTYFSLDRIAQRYDIAEINIIDRNGIIVESTNPDFIGFNMASGEQSAEFLCLLEDKTEYVQSYGPISYDSTISRKYAGIRCNGGILQLGYDARRFHADIDAKVSNSAKNRHVGETGFVMILDARNQLISSPAELTEQRLAEDTAGFQWQEEGKTFEMLLNGALCYCRYRYTEGFYLLAALPKTEALQMRNLALYVNSFLEVLVFAALFGLIYILIRKVVVNQIRSINNSLSKITGGNLDEVVNVRTNAEFASLSDDINSTVDTLKRYIAEASARIDKELEFAKNIQSSALPNTFPAFPKRKDFDIYALMNPAKEVGGDFYDFYLTHNNRLNFLVADVSGKGIPAAMFMMRAKTELKSLTEADIPLNDVFTNGNNALCEGNDAGMFVTAWQGGLDLTTGHLLFANAGHNPPLVRHENGKFEYLRSRAGFILAGMEGVRYKTQELQLAPGDIVFLYTDGVTEATNAAQQLYGEERLLDTVNSAEFSDMQELCRIVRRDVDSFVGSAPQFDDITMVALRYIGDRAKIYRYENAAIKDIPAATEAIEQDLEQLDCPMRAANQICVVIDEIFSNIVQYGYPREPGPVTLELRELDDPRAVQIRFIDEGIPYNPLAREDPDVTLSAEDRKIGGLGIFMVKKIMDNVTYERRDEKNIFTIVKNL